MRARILASIKPQALTSLLDEICTSDDAKILRAAVLTDQFRRPIQDSKPPYRATPRKTRPDKVCPICKQSGRSDIRHFLSECAYLPDSDGRYIVKARQIADILDEKSCSDSNPDLPTPPDCTAEDQPKRHIVTRRI